MTAVLLGKANAEALSVAQFKDLLGALIDAGYAPLSNWKLAATRCSKAT